MPCSNIELSESKCRATMEATDESDWYTHAYGFPKAATLVARCIGAQRGKPGAVHAIRVLAKQYDPSCVFHSVVFDGDGDSVSDSDSVVDRADWDAAYWMVHECGFDANVLLMDRFRSDGSLSISLEGLAWFRDVAGVRLSKTSKSFCDGCVKYDRSNGYISESECARYLAFLDTMAGFDAPPDDVAGFDAPPDDADPPRYETCDPFVTGLAGVNAAVNVWSRDFYDRHGLTVPGFL